MNHDTPLRRAAFYLPLVCIPLLALQACKEEATSPQPAPAPSSGQTPSPAPAPQASQPTAITAGPISLKIPAGWISSPPSSPMRLAELTVPDPSGDAARTCLTTISIAGGDVASNIARWEGQVKDASGQPAKAQTVVRDIAGMKVHVVEIRGTYQGMSDPAPLPEWMMRGAIVESGPQMVFIKSTGPAEGMTRITEGWNALVDSITRN